MAAYIAYLRVVVEISVTQIDLDDEALAEAMRLMGSTTKEDTVNAALRDYAWRWVDTAQYKLTQRGQHRTAGVIDLLVCATAVHHGHAVLHVDNDVTTVAAVLKELQQQDARA